MKLSLKTYVKQIAIFIIVSAAFSVFTGVKYFTFFASMFCKACLTRLRIKLCFDILRLINNCSEIIYQKLGTSTQLKWIVIMKRSPYAKNNIKRE